MLLTAFAAAIALSPDGHVRRDGFDLHYRTQGAGTPIVILSGGPGLDVEYMNSIRDALPAGYQLVFLEQRGTGRSTLPTITAETVSMKLVVEDLEALRIELKQKRLILAGHSWGGMLAMAYAAAHPDHVDRMVLIGSGGPTLTFTEWFGDNIFARLHAEDKSTIQKWAEEGKNGAVADKVELEQLKAMLPGYFFERAKALEVAAAFPDGSYHVAVNNLLFGEMSNHYDLTRGLKRLKRPVLIIQGHQDPIGDLTAREIQAAISGSQVVLLNKCGHFPWLERPEEFKKAVSDFMKSSEKA